MFRVSLSGQPQPLICVAVGERALTAARDTLPFPPAEKPNEWMRMHVSVVAWRRNQGAAMATEFDSRWLSAARWLRVAARVQDLFLRPFAKDELCFLCALWESFGVSVRMYSRCAPQAQDVNRFLAAVCSVRTKTAPQSFSSALLADDLPRFPPSITVHSSPG